jgi:hypothetical protein
MVAPFITYVLVRVDISLIIPNKLIVGGEYPHEINGRKNPDKIKIIGRVMKNFPI